MLKEKWLDKGYFSVATFQEPGWRIDGKKTLGLELAEPKQSWGPLEPAGRGDLPDRWRHRCTGYVEGLE